MELRIAAILGVISAGLQVFLHLIYLLLNLAGSGGGMGGLHVYTVMQVLGLLPPIGLLACFVFFLIGFNKLLAPATPQNPG